MPVVRLKPSVRLTPEGMTVIKDPYDVVIDTNSLKVGESVTVTK